MAARNEDEAHNIMLGKLQPGEASCTNCGEAFPPFHEWQADRYVYCGHWKNLCRKDYFCKAWIHDDDMMKGIAPPWCEPLTKRRLTKEEMDNVQEYPPSSQTNRLWHVSVSNRMAKAILDAMPPYIH